MTGNSVTFLLDTIIRKDDDDDETSFIFRLWHHKPFSLMMQIVKTEVWHVKQPLQNQKGV